MTTMYDWPRYNRVGKALLRQLDLLAPFIHPIKRQFLLARVDRALERERLLQQSTQHELDRRVHKGE